MWIHSETRTWHDKNIQLWVWIHSETRTWHDKNTVMSELFGKLLNIIQIFNKCIFQHCYEVKVNFLISIVNFKSWRITKCILVSLNIIFFTSIFVWFVSFNHPLAELKITHHRSDLPSPLFLNLSMTTTSQTTKTRAQNQQQKY